MATELRRRAVGNNDVPSSSPSPSPTPRSQSPVKRAGHDKTKVVHARPKAKRKTTAIFLLGSLFGIIAAGFFAKSNDLIDFPEFGELSMDSLFDVLPAGLVTDMRDLVVGCPLGGGLSTDGNSAEN